MRASIRHNSHCTPTIRRNSHCVPTPDAQNPESLLWPVVWALALRDLVPACPEYPGRLTRHSEEQGAFFGPLEQPCRSRPRFPEPTEGRAEGETEKVCGA